MDTIIVCPINTFIPCKHVVRESSEYSRTTPNPCDKMAQKPQAIFLMVKNGLASTGNEETMVYGVPKRWATIAFPLQGQRVCIPHAEVVPIG